MKIDKLERLHVDDLQLFEQAAKLAFHIAESEGLVLNVVIPKYRLDRGSAVGLCDTETATISLMIRHKKLKADGGAWHENPLQWLDISHTVAHEIAHLKHPNHSKEFREYENYLINKYTKTESKIITSWQRK